MSVEDDPRRNGCGVLRWSSPAAALLVTWVGCEGYLHTHLAEGRTHTPAQDHSKWILFLLQFFCGSKKKEEMLNLFHVCCRMSSGSGFELQYMSCWLPGGNPLTVWLKSPQVKFWMKTTLSVVFQRSSIRYLLIRRRLSDQKNKTVYTFFKY